MTSPICCWQTRLELLSRALRLVGLLAIAIPTLLAGSAFANVVIDEFSGTGGGAVIAGSSWQGRTTVSGGVLTTTGTAKNDFGWAGTQNINLPDTAPDAATSDYFHVAFRARRNSGHNSNTTLTLELEDNNGVKIRFSVSTSLFLTDAFTTAYVRIADWGTSGFDHTNIRKWRLGGGAEPGTGTNTFRLSIDRVEIAAEPWVVRGSLTLNPITPGKVEHQQFLSASMNRDVGYRIYFPDGYGAVGNTTRYPVIYFLHGGGGSESINNELMRTLLDTEIAAGRIPPVILIWAHGDYAKRWCNERVGSEGADDFLDLVETMFIQELIPHIDATYRTLNSRRSRAIMGFSQGGNGVQRLACKYPGLFRAGNAMSGGGPESGSSDLVTLYYDYPWDLATTNQNSIRNNVGLRLTHGDSDFQTAIANTIYFRDVLDSLSIPNTYPRILSVPGTQAIHDFPNLWTLDGVNMVKFLTDKMASTILLNSPQAGSTVAVGSAVSLTATPMDSLENFAKVDFLVDGQVVGTVASRPFTFQWSAAGVATHTFSAVATDALGGLVTVTGFPVTVVARPFDAWRAQQFSAAQLADPQVSGETADPDRDGLQNLLEYPLGLNPNSASTSGLPQVGRTSVGANKYVTLTFNRFTDRTDITYRVQVSGDLVTWFDGSSYSATTTTADNTYTTQVSSLGINPQTITVRDNGILNGNGRFMRLLISQP